MKKNALKFFAILIFVLIFLLGYYFNLNEIFSLEFIKKEYLNLKSIINQNYILYYILFFVIYVIITAFSLPIALIKTLLGGALFGFWPGLILVSFASSLGSTFCFLFSRYVFSDFVNQKFSKYIAIINKGIEKEGWMYLLFLRLSPIFPFFIINLVFGLTKMKTIQFYTVSQIGMFVGTAIFVNAGVQLGKLNSLEDILSIQIILSLTLIGIFPLITKKLYNYYKLNVRKN